MVRLLLPQARRAGPLHEPDPDHRRRVDVGAGARGRGAGPRVRPRHRRRHHARQPAGAGAGHRAPAGSRPAAGRGRADLEADRPRQRPQRVRAPVRGRAPGRADRHAAALPRRDRALRRQPGVLRPAAQVQRLPERRGRALGPLLDAGPRLPRPPRRARGAVPGAGGGHAGAEPASGVASAGAGPPRSGGAGDRGGARPVPRAGVAREAPPGAAAVPRRAHRRRRGAGVRPRAGAPRTVARPPAGARPREPERRPGRLVPAARPGALDDGPVRPARPAELAAARSGGGPRETVGERAAPDDARAGAGGPRRPLRVPRRGGHRRRRGRPEPARRHAGPEHRGVHRRAVLQHRGHRDQGRHVPADRHAAAADARPARHPHPHERLPIELRAALHGRRRPEGGPRPAARRNPRGLRRLSRRRGGRRRPSGAALPDRRRRRAVAAARRGGGERILREAPRGADVQRLLAREAARGRGREGGRGRLPARGLGLRAVRPPPSRRRPAGVLPRLRRRPAAVRPARG